MIVTKQRRKSQSKNQVSRNSQYNYSPFLQEKQNIFTTSNKPTSYQMHKQTAIKRQRNSIGSVTKLNNKDYGKEYQSSKKSQKKYDYSATFQQDNYRKFDRTQNKRAQFSNKNLTSKQHLKNEWPYSNLENERRRCSSVKNSTTKYKYTDYYLPSQQKILQPSKSLIKSSNYKNKYDGKLFSGTQNPQHYSTQKNSIQNYNPTSNKENRPTNTKTFFANQKYQNDFDRTEKFLQFKTQQKLINLQEQKSVNKYEPRYSRMRNNKRSQIINKTHQYLQEKTQEIQQNQNKDYINQVFIVNFQQLYKNSQMENKKITQKIHRITQLNSEINRRLQKMLTGKSIC